jgi:hypothetical protein
MDIHFFTLYTVSLCLVFLSVSVRPSQWRWIFWPLIIGFNWSYYCVLGATGVKINLGYTEMLSLISIIFAASDFILLTNVQQELRMVDQRQPVSNLGSYARMKWGLQLLLSGRGIGWEHEPRSVLPPHPTLTRVQFIKSRLGWLVANVLIHDAINILILKEYLRFDGPMDLTWRLWAVPIFSILSRIGVVVPHLVCSIVFVGSGLSEPAMWPYVFGNWSDAYTIRRFWGYENHISVFHLNYTDSLSA